ncbi:hypothetical protein [Conexibacter sp. SYSU D00693]|uniref:hypothetical protein n=1 Tax=Conexibacter sp. SYSU D00693 TaxID=2812560 RepID=UPI00196A3835|nr:hypothetical protein [Conexibacter sp. SYSU D00693]
MADQQGPSEAHRATIGPYDRPISAIRPIHFESGGVPLVVVGLSVSDRRATIDMRISPTPGVLAALGAFHRQLARWERERATDEPPPDAPFDHVLDADILMLDRGRLMMRVHSQVGGTGTELEASWTFVADRPVVADELTLIAGGEAHRLTRRLPTR